MLHNIILQNSQKDTHDGVVFLGEFLVLGLWLFLMEDSLTCVFVGILQSFAEQLFLEQLLRIDAGKNM